MLTEINILDYYPVIQRMVTVYKIFIEKIFKMLLKKYSLNTYFGFMIFYSKIMKYEYIFPKQNIFLIK